MGGGRNGPGEAADVGSSAARQRAGARAFWRKLLAAALLLRNVTNTQRGRGLCLCLRRPD